MLEDSSGCWPKAVGWSFANGQVGEKRRARAQDPRPLSAITSTSCADDWIRARTRPPPSSTSVNIMPGPRLYPAARSHRRVLSCLELQPAHSSSTCPARIDDACPPSTTNSRGPAERRVTSDAPRPSSSPPRRGASSATGSRGHHRRTMGEDDRDARVVEVPPRPVGAPWIHHGPRLYGLGRCHSCTPTSHNPKPNTATRTARTREPP